MIQELLIEMQLLISISHYFFRYNTITINWDVIKNSLNTPDILFVCLLIANLYYSLFKKRVTS